MRRILTTLIVVALVMASAPSAVAKLPSGPPAVVFVHGMGTSAADVGTDTHFGPLLSALAETYPMPDVCQKDAQPERAWEGSPCVFRYVEDIAEGGDSQSAVRDNADKLARELEEIGSNAAGAPITLIGYSMGGAIIRTYLAKHADEASQLLDKVVLIDAVASGSWGYTFATELPRRVGGAMGAKLDQVMRSMAATSASVDFNRPATKDLRPRSALFREIAPAELPRNISYYTFWGDIRMSFERQLLAYDLPDFEMPSFGDLGLLPGHPDPRKLPELGGQRFSPPVDDGFESLDIKHRADITLSAAVVRDLIAACGQKPRADTPDCDTLLGRYFQIPNTHTAMPGAMDKIEVDAEELGGPQSLLDAVLTAIGRTR